MANRAKSKTPAKMVMVRAVCLALAGIMVLSVVMAAIWQW